MTARASLRLLQIVLGVVLCAYSVALVVTELRSPHHSHAFVFLLLLGAAEALAAALFLFTVRLGGLALLVVFAAAAAFHLLHGQVSNVGVLAIYAASVLAVMANKRA